jgi:hypothetical protein
LKGQLKSLQKANPAGQPPPNLALWQKFAAARLAAKKPPGPAPSPPVHPRKKSQNNEVRLAFYTNGDPYSYSSLEQHASQITSLRVDGGDKWVGRIADRCGCRLPKLTANKGIALMPLLTTSSVIPGNPRRWKISHTAAPTQDRFIQKVLAILNDAKRLAS